MFKVSKALQDAVQKVLDDSPMAEALIGNQSKLDANKNGKLDKQDFKLLRGGKKENEKEKEELEEQRFKKGQDVGDPGLNFKKIAAKAAEKYGSKAAGQRVAGFVLKKKLANSRMSEQTDQIVDLEEGRPSQQHPLEDHEYHKKTDAELRYIGKDAHQAAQAMKNHNPKAEAKYLDQANDAATVRYWREKNGTPDWYKKKYGHIKEGVSIQELKKSTLASYVGQNAADQVDRASSASFNSGKVGDMYNKAAITRKDIKRVKMMGKALRKLADPNYGNK
jgi:hypothetical protein